MSMPAVEHHDEFVVDPDEVKVPESPQHRAAVDLIALAAQRRLGGTARIYRDMNWYPTDGGNAVAPDALVLPPGALEPDDRSYKQATAGGPDPIAAIEVPSHTDGYAAFREKLRRYRRLGVVSYVVELGRDVCTVERWRPDAVAPEDWLGRPIPELGGVVLVAAGTGELAVRLDDGTLARSDVELLHHAEARIAELEARLRAVGADPA